MTIPANIVLPDQFSKLVVWTYNEQIGEGEPVEVYAWPRFSFQFSGNNVGDCEVDIYGTHEGLAGTCWGLVATMIMPIHDRKHDPFVDLRNIPLCRTYKPVVRGTPDIGNNTAVILFCTKLFAPVPLLVH